MGDERHLGLQQRHTHKVQHGQHGCAQDDRQLRGLFATEISEPGARTLSMPQRRALLDPGGPGGPGRRSTLGAACENSLQYDLIPGSLARRVGPKQRAADAKVMVKCVLPANQRLRKVHCPFFSPAGYPWATNNKCLHCARFSAALPDLWTDRGEPFP